jgi:hypothetical protein
MDYSDYQDYLDNLSDNELYFMPPPPYSGDAEETKTPSVEGIETPW